MKNKELTREDVFTSDRGEREYYESRKSLTEKVRLPLTLDGCEALLEQVTGALEIPLDETTRQVFCGYIHHLPQTMRSTTYGEIGGLLYNHMAKAVTWKLDQNTKELRAKKETLLKASEEKPELKLAEGLDGDPGQGDSV